MSAAAMTMLLGIFAVSLLMMLSLRGRRWGWLAPLVPIGMSLQVFLLAAAASDPWRALLVTVAAVPAVGVWGLAARWARREPVPPLLDQSRLRWSPRVTHRITWVLFATASMLWVVVWTALGVPLASVLPLVAFAVCWRFAHQGERGVLRIESRDLVLGGTRVPLDDILQVQREVRTFPMWRVRLLLHRRHGPPLRLLVTGSPDRDVDAVVRLLCAQHHYASRHELDRGEEVAPPPALEALRLP